MADDDVQIERISLALYGGAIAALGILLVAGLFYARSAMATFDAINQSIAQLAAPPAQNDAPAGDAPLPSDLGDVTTDQPPWPSLQTQLALLVGATLPGSIVIAWALRGTWARGTVAVAAAHLLAAAWIALAGDTLADGARSTLLLVPGLIILLATLGQAGPPWSQRLRSLAVAAVPLPVAFALSVSGGWWAIPLAWLLLPVLAATALSILTDA